MAQPCRIVCPLLQNLSRLDGRLLAIGVPLLQGCDQQRIDDLAAHEQIARHADAGHTQIYGPKARMRRM